MKSFCVIALTILIFSAPAIANTSPFPYSFYIQPSCDAQSVVATLSAPQDASSCHAYAVANRLENTVIQSIGATGSADIFDQVFTVCSEASGAPPITFEDACNQLFSQL